MHILRLRFCSSTKLINVCNFSVLPTSSLWIYSHFSSFWLSEGFLQIFSSLNLKSSLWSRDSPGELISWCICFLKTKLCRKTNSKWYLKLEQISVGETIVIDGHSKETSFWVAFNSMISQIGGGNSINFHWVDWLIKFSIARTWSCKAYSPGWRIIWDHAAVMSKIKEK